MNVYIATYYVFYDDTYIGGSAVFFPIWDAVSIMEEARHQLINVEFSSIKNINKNFFHCVLLQQYFRFIPVMYCSDAVVSNSPSERILISGVNHLSSLDQIRTPISPLFWLKWSFTIYYHKFHYISSFIIFKSKQITNKIRERFFFSRYCHSLLLSLM